MNNLPPEILSEIVEVLANDSPCQLSAYACISRAWQGAIEQQLFRILKLHITELDKIQVIFKSANICRARFLVRLEVNFGRQSSDDAYFSDDTAEFSESIAHLFAILADMGNQANILPLLTLRFWADDYENRGSFNLILPNSLPPLHQVGRFIFVRTGNLYALRQSAIFEILKKLPKVYKAELSYFDDFQWGRRKRKAQREAFGSAICDADISGLQEFELCIYHSSLQDEDRKPDLLFPAKGSRDDAYFRILRHLSTFSMLKVIHLRGQLVIGVDIFSNMPTFPALADFQLDFAPETADGRWFFVKDEQLFKRIAEEESEEEEETDEHEADSESESSAIVQADDSEDEDGPVTQRWDRSNYYRTLPNQETLSLVLSDAARFVGGSPKLRRFILRCLDGGSIFFKPRNLGTERPFELWYLQQGTPRIEKGWPQIPADNKYMTWNRLYWRVGQRWKPDNEVMEAWCNATGPDTRVFFLKEECWNPPPSQNFPTYVGDLEDELV